MGITDNVYKYCQTYFDNADNILELGSQIYIKNRVNSGYFKNIFSHYNITSLDITGENNSLRLDLSKPLIHDKKYDLITNFGTTEHVSNQYECWKNIYNLLDENGIIISEIPEINSWSGHCKYYVDFKFFKMLETNFEIIDYRSIFYTGNGYLSFSILRKKCLEFTITKEEFYKPVYVDNNTVDRISY